MAFCCFAGASLFTNHMGEKGLQVLQLICRKQNTTEFWGEEQPKFLRVVQRNLLFGRPFPTGAISSAACLFPPWEKCPTEDFFFSSGRSVSEGSLYPPRVVFTHERSEGCNWDPRGVKMPEDTLLSEEKKKSKVVSFFTWRMWLSSILEVIPTSSECLILKQPLQPQTASNSLKTASKVFFCLI